MRMLTFASFGPPAEGSGSLGALSDRPRRPLELLLFEPQLILNANLEPLIFAQEALHRQNGRTVAINCHE